MVEPRRLGTSASVEPRARDARERSASMKERLSWVWRRGGVAVLGLSAALWLTGCTAIEVRRGMKTHLDKLPVTTIQATLPMGPAIAPGETSPLVVTFTDSNGKTWVTEGKGKG